MMYMYLINFVYTYIRESIHYVRHQKFSFVLRKRYPPWQRSPLSTKMDALLTRPGRDNNPLATDTMTFESSKSNEKPWRKLTFCGPFSWWPQKSMKSAHVSAPLRYIKRCMCLIVVWPMSNNMCLIVVWQASLSPVYKASILVENGCPLSFWYSKRGDAEVLTKKLVLCERANHFEYCTRNVTQDIFWINN